MPAAPIPDNEFNRIMALQALNILDTPPEERFDRVTRLATKFFDVPVALVSLVDSDRQWFKSCQGLDVSEMPRAISFCAHAILQDEVLVVSDARLDPRFADNPVVTDEPYVVFYAGCPLVTTDGSKVGTLCLVGLEPRTMTPEEIETLRDLAQIVMSELNLTEASTLQAKSAEALQLTQFSVDSAPQAILWIDEAAQVLNANEGACVQLGYSREELLQLTIADFDPNFTEEIFSDVWQNLRQHQSITLEVIHQRKDGSQFPVDLTMNFLEYEGQEYLFAFATDITKRKQAEEERQRLSNILETTIDWVSMATPDGKLMYVNRGGREMLGLDLEEDITQTHISEYYPKRVLPFMKSEVLPTAVKEGAWSGENALLNRDGQEIPVLQVVTAQRSADGTVEYLATIMRDITKRKQVEDALQQTSTVIENSPVVLFRWRIVEGEDLPVEYVSENIRRFGYTPEELTSGTTPFASIIYPDDREPIRQELAEHLASGVNEFTQEYRLLTKDGDVRWTDDRTVVERDAEGKVTHIQGIVLDITERKQTEMVLQENEALLDEAQRIANLGVWTWDVATDKVTWTDPLYEMFKIPKQPNLSLESYANVIHPDDRGWVLETIQTAMGAGDATYTFEHRAVLPDGEIRDVSIYGRIFRNKTGEPTRLIGVAQDITERTRIEQELMESRDRFELAVAGANDGIWDWNLQTNVAYLSPRWKAIIGYTDDELPNDFSSFEGHLHPDDRDKVFDRLNKYLEGEVDTYEVEFRQRHKDGEYRWVLARGSALRDSEGKPYRMAGSHSDITERKQTAEALRFSEERLELATVNSKVGIWDWDIVNGTLYWSPQFKASLGYGDELEVTFETFADLLHPDDTDTSGALDAHLKEGVPYSLEQRMRHKSGDYHWYRVEGQATFDEQGQPLRMIGTGIDITERKQAELALQENESLLEEAQRVANLGVWTWDVATDEVTWTEPLFEMFKMPKQSDLSLESYANVIHPEDRERVLGAIQTAMGAGDATYTFEHRAVLPDDEIRDVSIFGRIFRNKAGEPVRLIGVAQDITEQKEAEAAVQVSEARYRDLYENALLAYITANAKGEIELVNAETSQMLGYPREALIGRPVFEFCADNQFGKPRAYEFAQRINTGEGLVNQEEIQFQRADGTLIWVNLSLQPIIDPELNQVIGRQAVLEDVTARKALEEVLQIRTQAIEASVEPLSIADARQPDMPLIYVNPAFERVTGYTAEEVIGKNCRFLQGDDRDQPELETLRAAIKEGTACVVTLRNYRKDGTLFINELKMSPVYNEQGELTYFLGSQSDVTERLQAEESLRESEAQFRQTLAALPVGVAVSQVGGSVLYANEAYAEFFGGTVEDVMQRHATKFYTDSTDREKLLADLKKQGFVRNLELQFNRMDNTPVWGTISMYPIIYNSEPSLLSVFYDLTERREAEVEREQLLAESEIQSQRLTLLYQMGQDLAIAENEQTMFNITAQTIAQMFGSSRGSVALLDETRSHFEILALKGNEAIPVGAQLSMDGTMLGEVVRQNQTLVADNFEAEEWRNYLDIQGLSQQGLRSCMDTPIRAGNQVIGTLNVASNQPNGYSQQDESLIGQVAALLSSAIENRRLFERQQEIVIETEEQAQRLAFLNDMSRDLNQTATTDEVYQVAARYVSQIVSADRVSVGLLNEISNQIEIFVLDEKIGLNPANIYADRGSTIIGQVFETRQMTVTLDTSQSELSQALTRQGYLSSIVTPLISGERILGTLNIGSEQINAYQEREQQLAQQLASLIATTLVSRESLAETQATLTELEEIQRRYTLEAWEDYRVKVAQKGFEKVENAIIPLDEARLPAEAYEAVSQKKPILKTPNGASETDGDSTKLVVPLTLQNEIIGILGLEDPASEQPWTEDEVRLVESIVEQMVLSAETLRLFEETQQKAAQQQTIREITEKMRSAVDFEELVRFTAEALGDRLAVDYSFVELNSTPSEMTSSSNGYHSREAHEESK